MMKIPLTRGQVALVDDGDFRRLSKLRWMAHKQKGGNFYAIRNTLGPHSTRKQIPMHREILGVTDARVKVDHENHDTLDNRRRNLRLATPVQNSQNRKGAQSNSGSGHRGVCWETSREKWRVTIRVEGRNILLGRFDDLRKAVAAYAAANRQHFGDFGGLKQ